MLGWGQSETNDEGKGVLYEDKGVGRLRSRHVALHHAVTLSALVRRAKRRIRKIEALRGNDCMITCSKTNEMTDAMTRKKSNLFQ